MLLNFILLRNNQQDSNINKDGIGNLARIVWRVLNDKRSLSLEELQRETRLDTESVCTAIGWLARENKIEFDEQNGITSFYVYQERYY
ncbi:MAG: winged helix-turn-helix domain-containing protein [Bacteroidaceae bacterium]|nr:winged helix-turn-helix domain-containing protein [Bacteroidaceae bacterium]